MQGVATSLNRHWYSPSSRLSLYYVAQPRIAAISCAVGGRLVAWAPAGTAAASRIKSPNQTARTGIAHLVAATITR